MGSKCIFRPPYLNSRIFIIRHGFETKSTTVCRCEVTLRDVTPMPTAGQTDEKVEIVMLIREA